MKRAVLSQKPSLRLHIALLAVQIAFASLAVEGKVAMAPPHHVSSTALAMARILGGAVVFVVMHRVLGTPRVTSWRDRGGLALLSVFGVVVNQALFLAGLHRTSPMSATLLIATIPVFTALIGALTGREKISAKAALGIGVALFGVAYLTGFAVPPRGDLFVLANALSYAIYLVFSKPLLQRYGAITFMAWVFGSAALIFAPVGALTLALEVPTLSAAAASLVAFVVLVPTVFAYSMNAWALERATPTLVTVYVYFQPLVVAGLAWLQLGQAVTPRTLIAGLLILLGVGIVASASRSRSRRAAKAVSS